MYMQTCYLNLELDIMDTSSAPLSCRHILRLLGFNEIIIL